MTIKIPFMGDIIECDNAAEAIVILDYITSVKTRAIASAFNQPSQPVSQNGDEPAIPVDPPIFRFFESLLAAGRAGIMGEPLAQEIGLVEARGLGGLMHGVKAASDAAGIAYGHAYRSERTRNGRRWFAGRDARKLFGRLVVSTPESPNGQAPLLDSESRAGKDDGNEMNNSSQVAR